MQHVINLLAALGLFYSGFVHTFWGTIRILVGPLR